MWAFLHTSDTFINLQSYYIKNTHTAMIERLDNRTRIPY